MYLRLTLHLCYNFFIKSTCFIMFRTLLFVFLLQMAGVSNAQTISGIVNRYTAVTAIDTCNGWLMVTDTSGFVKGDVVLLIQMQGAAIATGNNSAYGNIQSINGAGRYERAELDSVGPAGLYLRRQLVHSYDVAGKVQVVRVARYQQVTVSDTLLAKPWDGITGGILALEVNDTLVLDAPVVADGAGFRGGTGYVAPGNNCNFLIPEAAYFYGLGNWRGANKGEGVARKETGKELARGPQANGGGGGNDHNSGGGGGAHVTRGGGGGENDEPTAFGCDGYFPGIGGYSIPDASLRLFPGGGGGAGHANNTLDGSGGNGGGIIWIQAGVITGSQPFISANGASAGTANGDGGGGGGAGGTVWVQTTAAPGQIQLMADGGQGGSTFNNNANRCFGPGGGGSGGRILTNLMNVALPAGGLPGIVTGSTNVCNSTSNNAEAGENGRLESLAGPPQGIADIRPVLLTNTSPDTVCVGDAAFFYIHTNTGNWDVQWQQNDGSGWQNIAPNMGFSGFLDDTLMINTASITQNNYQFRCRVQRAGCFEITSSPAHLIVKANPIAAFSVSISTDLAVFANQSVNANAYAWSFGDGQFSTASNPQHTYASEGNFTVTLTIWNDCDTVSTTQQLAVFLLPTAGFAVPDTALGCGSTTVMFDNLSSDNSAFYQWSFPGGLPDASIAANPVITYAGSGNYSAALIVGNNAGFDTLVQNFTIQIIEVAAANFTYSLLPGGVVQVVNTSTGGANYTWDFGDGSPQVQADSIVTHQYLASGTYTLTLIASNACGASVFQQNTEVTVEGVATQNIGQADAIQLYPNPLYDFLIIDCSGIGSPPDQVVVLDMLGRLVFSQQYFTEIRPVVALHALPAGLYWVQVSAGTYVKRQIVQRVSGEK